MSRSRKLPIVKDHHGCKRMYHRTIRSAIKNYMRSCKDLEALGDVPNPKTIMNDWTYCDYTFDCRPCSCGIHSRSHCSLWKKRVGYDPTRDDVCKECRKENSRK